MQNYDANIHNAIESVRVEKKMDVVLDDPYNNHGWQIVTLKYYRWSLSKNNILKNVSMIGGDS